MDFKIKANFSNFRLFFLFICLIKTQNIYFDSTARNSTEEGTPQNPLIKWQNLSNRLGNSSNYFVFFNNTNEINFSLSISNSNVTFRSKNINLIFLKPNSSSLNQRENLTFCNGGIEIVNGFLVLTNFSLVLKNCSTHFIRSENGFLGIWVKIKKKIRSFE